MYLDARQTSANVTLIAGSQDAVPRPPIRRSRASTTNEGAMERASENGQMLKYSGPTLARFSGTSTHDGNEIRANPALTRRGGPGGGVVRVKLGRAACRS